MEVLLTRAVGIARCDGERRRTKQRYVAKVIFRDRCYNDLDFHVR